MSLTINILVKNNEKTIEATLECASKISNKIVVGDAGCTDDTIKKCKKYDAKIVNLPFKGDRSVFKNYMVEKNSSSWMLFMEPGEVFLSQPNFLNFDNEKTAYRVKLINGDLITKEVRIWHTSNPIKFKNPVFETPSVEENIKNLEVFLISNQAQIDEEKIQSLNEWRLKNPISKEPLYYIACSNLIQKKWKNFINSAEVYLYANNSNDSPALMTRYYISMVKSCVKEELDYEGAIKNLIICLAEKPLMAEFWCLLGDIHCRINENEKARGFYQNAILLGSKRKDDDDLPIEISKYKRYPEKMIEAFKELKEKTQMYRSETSR